MTIVGSYFGTFQQSADFTSYTVHYILSVRFSSYEGVGVLLFLEPETAEQVVSLFKDTSQHKFQMATSKMPLSLIL